MAHDVPLPDWLDVCASSGAPCYESVLNPYYGVRHERRYDATQQRELMGPTQFEHEVGAAAASGFLEDDESHRIRAFIDGSSRKRALLVGSVDAASFLDFVIYDGGDTQPLLGGGRSVRQVVATIRAMGGLDAAATAVPWLAPVVTLAAGLDWRRLASRLIFVRRACAAELASVPQVARSGAGVAIEEGMHRALAAAWLLTRNGTAPPPHGAPRLAYLRGVNRLGHACGEPFWAVGTDTAEGALACALPLACALAVRALCRRGATRPKPRPAARAARATGRTASAAGASSSTRRRGSAAAG